MTHVGAPAGDSLRAVHQRKWPPGNMRDDPSFYCDVVIRQRVLCDAFRGIDEPLGMRDSYGGERHTPEPCNANTAVSAGRDNCTRMDEPCPIPLPPLLRRFR